MASERLIENNLIRNREQLGYPDSLYIRRCRAGRGFGIVDLMILPQHGPHRVVLVEAKQARSVDAPAKVVGQLLLYYAGVLHLGSRGLHLLREFAAAHPVRARNANPKLLKTLTGGVSPPELAWREMQKGARIRPRQVALYVALDGPPSSGLKTALTALTEHHSLSIGIVSVLGYNQLEIWRGP